MKLRIARKINKQFLISLEDKHKKPNKELMKRSHQRIGKTSWFKKVWKEVEEICKG